MNLKKYRPGAIAVGNFDGFHLGHQKIVENLQTIAAKEKLVSHVITFAPNPKKYFGKEPYLIFTDEQKKKFLEELAVDEVTFVNFLEVAGMPAQDFLETFLIKKYQMKYIVVGENFGFGKGREGNIAFLKAAARTLGFGICIVPPEKIDGTNISSSYIRSRLAQGLIDEANRMLGRPYSIEGVVSEGDHMGRELGFPTINVKPDNLLLPEGVFETRVKIGEEENTFESITNIGYRPTFSGKEKRVESHLFNFDRQVYGQQVTIYFERKLRDEIQFASRSNLIEQIKKDIKNLRI